MLLPRPRWEKEVRLVGEQPQPKLGISPAKHVLSKVEGTQRPQRWEKNGEGRLQDYQSFPSELGVLCAFARVNPRIGVFQVTGNFA